MDGTKNEHAGHDRAIAGSFFQDPFVERNDQFGGDVVVTRLQNLL